MRASPMTRGECQPLQRSCAPARQTRRSAQAAARGIVRFLHAPGARRSAVTGKSSVRRTRYSRRHSLTRSAAARSSRGCRNRHRPLRRDTRTRCRRPRSARAPSGRSCPACRRRCGTGRSSRCHPTPATPRLHPWRKSARHPVLGHPCSVHTRCPTVPSTSAICLVAARQSSGVAAPVLNA